jgi:hypothetical protein
LWHPNEADTNEANAFVDFNGSDDVSMNAPIRLPEISFTKEDKITPQLRKLMNVFIRGAIGEFID